MSADRDNAGRRLDAEGRLLRFPHLDVAILDDTVYTTTRGLFLLGPLATAAAASKRLPAGADCPGFGEHFMIGAGSAKKTERTAVAVVSGESSHRLVIEHTSAAWTPWQVEKQVAEFNSLAVKARSLPSRDSVDALPD